MVGFMSFREEKWYYLSNSDWRESGFFTLSGRWEREIQAYQFAEAALNPAVTVAGMSGRAGQLDKGFDYE